MATVIHKEGALIVIEDRVNPDGTVYAYDKAYGDRIEFFSLEGSCTAIFIGYVERESSADAQMCEVWLNKSNQRVFIYTKFVYPHP